MGIQKKPEEQFRSEIFSIYSHYNSEIYADRRQVYFAQLCESTLRWCSRYFLKEANDMGYEIFMVLQRMVNSNDKIPNTKSDFFNYLKAALYNAKSEHFRSFESNLINIPKDKISKIKKIDDIIRMEESNTSRKLSENERVQFISKWFDMPEKEVREYLYLKNVRYVNGLTNKENNDEADTDILNTEKAHIPYLEKTFINPEKEYFAKLSTSENVKRILNAVKSILNNTQDRTRECYRALFTVYCIDNAIDFEGLSSLLNSEIVETFRKNGKKPKLLEVYLKYHPDVKRESAGARASEMNKKFLNNLYTILKENNPLFFL